MARNKTDPFGNSKRSVWGNIWKRDIHRERNLVVARINSESSGLKKSNTFEQFQMNKSDENKEKFREANRARRKAVRIAKLIAYEDLIQSWIPEKG